MDHIETVPNFRNQIGTWRANELAEWCSSLSFLSFSSRESITTAFQDHWIDGATFMKLRLEDWISLGLNYRCFFLLNCIRDGLIHAWKKAITIPIGTRRSCHLGMMTDLSVCDEETAERLKSRYLIIVIILLLLSSLLLSLSSSLLLLLCVVIIIIYK